MGGGGRVQPPPPRATTVANLASGIAIFDIYKIEQENDMEVSCCNFCIYKVFHPSVYFSLWTFITGMPHFMQVFVHYTHAWLL